MDTVRNATLIELGLQALRERALKLGHVEVALRITEAISGDELARLDVTQVADYDELASLVSWRTAYIAKSRLLYREHCTDARATHTWLGFYCTPISRSRRAVRSTPPGSALSISGVVVDVIFYDRRAMVTTMAANESHLIIIPDGVARFAT